MAIQPRQQTSSLLTQLKTPHPTLTTGQTPNTNGLVSICAEQQTRAFMQQNPHLWRAIHGLSRKGLQHKGQSEGMGHKEAVGGCGWHAE